MKVEPVRPSTISVIIRSANPIFILLAMGLPIGVLIYALNFGSLTSLNFVHIMTGALWTGIDLFMGFVLGPVLGGMEPRDRAGVFKRLVPKMTFLMPALATVTIMSGIELAERLRIASLANLSASLANPWILSAVVIAGILTVQGFGLLLPNEIRVFRQLLAETPDIGKISRLGMMNAKLGGVQGILQLAVIFVMANLRF
ncbi:MAG: hypothetical protein Q8O55_10570 [Dehalococcoidales bacterium]|nr:hypothetical protein [Dehalococcoidales bacterium]